MEQPKEQEYNIVKVVVDPGQAQLRIDVFLVSKTERLSRSRIQNAANEGLIMVNNKAVKPNYKVRPGDVITLHLPTSSESNEVVAQDIPLNIVYEDDDVLVLNKDAGMVVHPGHGNREGTMANALLWHFKNNDLKGLNPERPGIVHRIDKLTTGLLVIAKNEYALTFLSKQFADKTATREYYALVWGDFEEEEGTINAPIGRSIKDRKKFSVTEEGEGKDAITHYRVVENLGYVTLIACKLETGRTHQIRVHMQSINHPLFGDKDYGGNKVVKGTIYSKYKQFVENCFKLLPRQALHAKTLGFIHPTTKEYMEFNSELPNDIEAVLTKWRTYTKDLREKLG